jgi:hypothetical protein
VGHISIRELGSEPVAGFVAVEEGGSGVWSQGDLYDPSMGDLYDEDAVQYLQG